VGPFPAKAIDQMAELATMIKQQSMKTEVPKESIRVIQEKPPNKIPKGLHNKNMDVNVERGSFKTLREIDIDNLSAQDKAAKKALRTQGWNDKKIKEVLSSGDHFQIKELKTGDKLYGFDTEGRSKDINNSAYWTDEKSFNRIKQQHYKNGTWDKEGVKNTLALPCYNRADSISVAKLKENTTSVQSTVGKATELIKYSDASGYDTGLLGKIMPGGGTQTTVDPSLLKLLGN